MTMNDLLALLDAQGHDSDETDGFEVLVNDALTRKQAGLLDVMVDKERGLILLEVDGMLA